MPAFAAILADRPDPELGDHLGELFVPPDRPPSRSVAGLVALAGDRLWQADRLLLVGNIRIDNGPELRAALDRASGEDGELILTAWRRWGVDALAKLVGDFAFVLWDAHTRTLVAARDGLGMATLCYRRLDDRLLLASDIEQLARTGPTTPDSVTLAGWLSGWPDPHRSPFGEIEVLPPGHALIADDRGLRVQQFWQVDPAHRLHYDAVGDYAEHLAELLGRTVRDRLRGADQVACQMSGGLDSTSVTALAVEALPRQPLVISHTYAETAACDEQPLVKAMAEHLGLEQIHWIAAERHLDLPYEALYPPAMENPGVVRSPRYADECALIAEQGARVLLTGSGGDELTWGHALNYPHRLRQGDLGVVLEVARGCRAQGLPVLRTLGQLLVAPLLRGAAYDPARGRRLPDWIRREAIDRLDLRAQLLHEDRIGFANPAQEARYQALRRTATYNAVRSWEQVARRHGIEVRHPFFDTRLVEFSLAIPDDLWNREGYPKWLLRKAMQGRLPDAVRWNRKKVTFDDFFVKVIRRQPEPIRQLLAHPALADMGLLDTEALLAQYDDTIAGRRPFNVDLLYALMTQAWVARFG